MVLPWNFIVPINISMAVLTTILLHPTVKGSKPSPSTTTIDQDITSINQILDSAERLVVFLAMHPKRAVSTGQGLGLAVALGALHSRREGRISSRKYPPRLLARLSSFKSTLDAVLGSLRNHPRRSPLEARLLEPQLWSFPQSLPAPLPNQYLPPPPESTPTEDNDNEEGSGNQPAAVLLELRALGPWYQPTPKQSDACLTQLLLARRCSRFCLALATGGTQPRGGPSASGYALTHRLLFLLVARQVGCTDVPLIDDENPIRNLCSSMLDEAETISFLGYPELLKDLFVEQVTLCGLAGYREFLRPSWRSTILDWQRPSGCFGNWTAEMTSLQPFLHFGDTRGDADLGGGCLAHLTDVAAGALGVFLSQLL